MRRNRRYVGNSRTGQCGQALAEGVLALAALTVLFWAIPVIGRYQDIALQTTHASRHAAFSAAQKGVDDTHLLPAIQQRFFAQPHLRWRDASGRPLLDGGINLQLQRTASGSALQPATPEGQTLYRDWRLHDQGVLSARVSTSARDVSRGVFPAFVGTLAFTGHTAVLSGAGHAVSDADVQRRVASGDSGWGRAARQSSAAGRAAAQRLRGVDAAWGRAQPSFDWLTPWTALVPQDRLPRVHTDQSGELP